MNHCLPEETLLMLHCGDGTDSERAHLRACRACDARRARLARDLQLIDRVLSEAPPPRTSAPRLTPRLWIPVAALAGMAALAIATTRLWSSAPTQVAAAAASTSVFAEDVSAALFATPNSLVLTAAASDVAHLQAALSGGWPCTEAQLLNGDCDDQLGGVLLEDD